jgi:hypothetical protein
MPNPLREAIGRPYVREIDADELAGGGLHRLAGRLQAGDRPGDGELRPGQGPQLIKPLIAAPPDFLMVNEKNEKPYDMPNICAAVSGRRCSTRCTSRAATGGSSSVGTSPSRRPPRTSMRWSLGSSAAARGWAGAWLLARDVAHDFGALWRRWVNQLVRDHPCHRVMGTESRSSKRYAASLS